MQHNTGGQAVRRAANLLREWLARSSVSMETRLSKSGDTADLIVRTDRGILAIDFKVKSDSGSIAGATQHLKAHASALGDSVVPVLAVPYMSDAGQKACQRAGVQWFDLSGNADIVAQGLRILVQGRPNLFARRGRPSNVFAPRSSRIARRLLLEPQRWFNQRELSLHTELDEGFTSRIVRKLEADTLIERDQGCVRVRDPDLLLDAWHDAYDFSKHNIIRGNIPSGPPEENLRRVRGVLDRLKVQHAVTGFTATWAMTRSASKQRLTTLVLRDEPSEALRKAIGFRADDRDANIWLVVPNDDGVFMGAWAYRGVVCLHPVQVYLDLKGHPEGSEDAATHLRKRLLTWWRSPGRSRLANGRETPSLPRPSSNSGTSANLSGTLPS